MLVKTACTEDSYVDFLWFVRRRHNKDLFLGAAAQVCEEFVDLLRFVLLVTCPRILYQS